VIGVQLGIEQSAMTPVAPGPHFPGASLALGLAIMTPAVRADINAVIAEQRLCSGASAPARLSYQTTDTASGSDVSRQSAAVGG
jgi:hypothetical protein